MGGSSGYKNLLLKRMGFRNNLRYYFYVISNVLVFSIYVLGVYYFSSNKEVSFIRLIWTLSLSLYFPSNGR